MQDKINSYLEEYKKMIKESILQFAGKHLKDDNKKMLSMIETRKKEILNIIKNGVDIGGLVESRYKVKDIIVKNDDYYFQLDIRSKKNLCSFREVLR